MSQTPSTSSSSSNFQSVIDHGADVNSWDCNYDTPLNRAANRRHVDVVRISLKHHADVNSHDKWGNTPLHNTVWASGFYTKENHPRVVRLLPEHDADVDAKEIEGSTPLEATLVFKRGEIVQLLSEFRSGGVQYGFVYAMQHWAGVMLQ